MTTNERHGLLDRPIAAFDIETIPDPEIGRRVLGLEGDDSTVVHRMVEQRLEETDGRTGYPQLPYHRVVTVGVAWIDLSRGRFRLDTVGGAAMDERGHLEGFYGLVREGHVAPRLVSWNGSGFDLPVLRYRALKHGLAAPELYRQDGDRRWNNYQNRFHDLHLDLMDVLSGYRASPFAGLGRMCELLEVPNKQFLTEPIYDHILGGEEAIVAEYCKLDCLDTLLVFLAWSVHTGELGADEMLRSVSLVRDGLRAEPDESWSEIAAALEDWPRWASVAPVGAAVGTVSPVGTVTDPGQFSD